ncbi:MAG: hypothetical protein U0326_17280 [Polyangiales bacterium]
MTKKDPATFPVPGQLGALLNEGELRAEIRVTRADGAAPGREDLASVRATLEVWELREREIMDVIRRAAKLLPAREALPSKKILAAVAEAGGLRAPSKPRAKARKGARATAPKRGTAKSKRSV